MDLSDFDFEFDEDAPDVISYYILGERPIKVTSSNGAPVMIETINFETKQFHIDNTLIRAITDSTEIQKVDEIAFRNFCLSRGVKPI